MKNNMWIVYGTLGKVGFVIALPLAILAYLGRKLDIYYQTSPLFILSGMAIAIVCSSLIVYRMAKKLEQ